ncbi:hypothetical protein [Rubrivirga sp.]|uniref:hypothetical protein n=1 Tax=Rubrivirga sp. TaxID=1885344 RepID=UPI003C76EDF6
MTTRSLALALLAALLDLTPSAAAQTTPDVRAEKQLEFSVGVVLPQVLGGEELLRSRDLRDAGLSYHAGPDGARRDVGDYGALTGFRLEVAYHRPLTRGLLYGVVVNSSLTGTQPSEGGYAEGYFFNTVDVGPSLKVYPLDSGAYVRGTVGMASVFTKDRFVGDSGEQEFFHQFGIGVGGQLDVGYTLAPFADPTIGVEVRAGYRLSTARVEVNGLGDDAWRYGSLHADVGIVF